MKGNTSTSKGEKFPPTISSKIAARGETQTLSKSALGLEMKPMTGEYRKIRSGAAGPWRGFEHKKGKGFRRKMLGPLKEDNRPVGLGGNGTPCLTTLLGGKEGKGYV